MHTKEEICKIYFNNKVKPKHLQEFKTTTPQANIIEGYINRKPNEYLGSLYIYKLNGKETSQFVYSMPKINYLNNHNQLADDDSYREYFAYEKLDGSCLILYPLLLNGKVIEIIPKTRGMPVADQMFYDMFRLVDQSRIFLFFQDHMNTTLLFEMFGFLNQHDILYPKTYIDIRLIGATRESEVLTDRELDIIANEYDFTRPFALFHIIYFKNKWHFNQCCEGSDVFYYMPEIELVYYPKLSDCLNAICDVMQQINENYYKQHQRIMIEGCVINGVSKDSKRQLYIKLKPWDIFEKCKTENGIPRKFILKEVRKYFDEYGSNIKEIYMEDKNHYKEYINQNLLEEFSKDAVDNRKTQNRIKDVFFDIWDMKVPNESIQKICQELVDKYPDLSVSELMRKFAVDYPNKKRHARIVYSVLSKKR